MGRKSMDLEQFNTFMRRCSEKGGIRYVTPTIHPGFKIIVSVTIHTSNDSVDFTITNNPDENFDLNEAVHNYLDTI